MSSVQARDSKRPFLSGLVQPINVISVKSYGSTRRLGFASSTRSLIYRILGTPDEDNWPGVTSLPDYKTTFPQWAGVPLPSHIRGLDADGLELLTSMLIYDPAHRMSGRSLFFFSLSFPSSPV
jgi:hypothetical protein